MIGADPRFMLVDDDPDFHEIFGDFLALALPGGEYELACFNDPDAAVEALHDRYYTTVFVDYRLGATTGIEFIRNCQLGGSHAPFILLTGYESHAAEDEALAIGAFLVRVSSTAGGGALAALGIAALLLGFGAWSAVRAGYTFDDSNREILVYAQGGSDLKVTFAALEEQVFSSSASEASNGATNRRAVEVDYDVWYPFQWYVREAESDGRLRFTCFKDEGDDGWNDSCNSLYTPPGEDEFKPHFLLLASDHANRRGGELEDYEKSGPLHSLLWYPETYRRPSEARQDEEWKDEFKMDLGFFKDVASSRGAWHSALSYWIFRDLRQHWFTGDYYSYSR